MSKPVRLHPSARRELVEAGRWYARERDELATELRAEVAHALDEIGDRPEARPPAPDAPADIDVRQAFLGRFPYRLVFLELEDVVFVLAVAHKRKRPGFWLGRLG